MSAYRRHKTEIWIKKLSKTIILLYNNRPFEHYVTAVMFVELDLISFFVCNFVYFQHRPQIIHLNLKWLIKNQEFENICMTLITIYSNSKRIQAYDITIMGVKYTTLFGSESINWLNKNYKRRMQLFSYLSAKWKFIESRRSSGQLRPISSFKVRFTLVVVIF